MPAFSPLAVLAGSKRKSLLSDASAVCSKKLQSGEINSFSECIADKMGGRKHSNKFSGIRSRHSTGRPSSDHKRSTNMKIGTASKLCSAKHGVKGKANRKACMRRKMGKGRKSRR